MKFLRTLLYVILFGQLINFLPEVAAGFGATLAIAVIVVLIEKAIESIINYGVYVIEAKENEKIKEAAIKFKKDPNGLSDREKEILAKGLMMHDILDRVYRINYDCVWSEFHKTIQFRFNFPYKNGMNISYYR